MIGGIAESRRAIDCNIAGCPIRFYHLPIPQSRFFSEIDWIGIVSLDNEIIDIKFT